MDLITLNIPSQPNWVVGTEIDLYTDDGGGTLATTPTNGRRIRCFPELEPSYRYGSTPYGRFVYADVRPLGGYGDDPYGDDPYGQVNPRVTVRLPVKATDQGIKFAAKVYDRGGNVQTTSVVASLTRMNLTPPAAYDLTFTSYDGALDQVAVGFSQHTE